ncbi:cysteine dioxygenase [Streptomyces sp. H27-D2]|uniref:cysteine dioxygenase n=1 Tax=Streptomyces sp. H27-D2 TaxID=3046304 RepID=UPI002DB55A3B|nr:cysteine dioxygenase [Streptomyces sp. H27-D2]MEC4015894.1 cysteine dioxygenase [Streptomyces sp. H27-D2]
MSDVRTPALSAPATTVTALPTAPLTAPVPAPETPPAAASATASALASVPPPATAPQSTEAPRTAPPTVAELLDFAHRVAADTELIGSLPLDPEGRTWMRLDGPAGSEAWLISWPPGTGTGWHDHGGSHGAFASAAGDLTEQSLTAQLPTEGWRTLELAEDVDRERLLSPGRGRAFGPHHVHQVLNLSAEHAISVHAYYPPLPLMRRYSRTGLVLRLEQVERAEEWA